MNFSELGIGSELLQTLLAQGYTSPTPVQTEAIPLALQGRDILASAQTGSGKTAAFLLPIVQRLAATPVTGKRVVRALILTPTRELALQVGESAQLYGRPLHLKSTELYGGVGMGAQISSLRKGLDIVVATPGRLLDHFRRGNLKLDAVNTVVLDEADRMLDMGFLPDIEEILALLPETRQTLLFSATFAPMVRKLASHFLRGPAVVDLAPESVLPESISHLAYSVDSGRKSELLAHLLSQTSDQTLVFTRTKIGAENLSQDLKEEGWAASAIHGDKSQKERTRALAAFKHQDLQVLVATDVAARGLDIVHLPQVINFELPQNADDYVHRIGRTGRAGQSGTATSLIARDERGRFRDIQRVLHLNIPLRQVPGFEVESSDFGRRPSKRQFVRSGR